MLVLKRGVNERIYVDGGRLVITPVEIRPSFVKIGIEAPPGIAIDREEVHFAKRGARPMTPDEAEQLGRRLLYSTMSLRDALDVFGLDVSLDDAKRKLEAAGVARCHDCRAWKRGDDCDCLTVDRLAERWMERVAEACETFTAIEEDAEGEDEELRGLAEKARRALHKAAVAIGDVASAARRKEVDAA